MKCAWQELLALLPQRVRPDLERLGRSSGQEIRFRIGQVPELVCHEKLYSLSGLICREEMSFVINAASRYSPWSAASSASGYLTGPGGHRIGICGEVILKEGVPAGIRNVTSLCIRIARDFPGIAREIKDISGSVLIIGPPGSGKTTFLRDLIRQVSTREIVGVVDERGELFPEGFLYGNRIDVLRNCPKKEGVEMILRTMGSQCIAVDEITAASDCETLLRAGWCGVRIFATAHAGSVRDLMRRPLYRPLLENGLFDHILVMTRDKSWREERILP